MPPPPPPSTEITILPTASSSKCTLELSDILAPNSVLQKPSSITSKKSTQPPPELQPPSSAAGKGQDEETPPPESDPPDGASVAPALPPLQKWNDPPINKWRLLAAFFSFVVLGMNDAAAGALIPYLEKYYDINFITISLIFLSPFVGYTIAAFINDFLHNHIGRRGVGMLASGFHLLAYIIMALHPPYPVLVVVMCIAGAGSGCMDSAYNSYIGVLARSNEILGILHGMYGLGGILSPIIATSMITQGHLPWYHFYYIMTAMAALAVIFAGVAFWGETGAKYRSDHPRSKDEKGGRTREAMRNKITWIIAFFLFIYVGAEVSLGGWIVTFMIRVRSGDPFAAGMVSAGFWIGLTVGRLTLGWVTGHFGEKKMVTIYLLLTIALELIFWLVPQFYVSAISVALIGFFIGPLFPSAIVVETRLMPARLHVSAVGFAAALGGSGAAIFPFAVGAIAQSRGVEMMHPLVLGLLVGQLGLWLLLPKHIPKTHAS